MFFYGRFLEVSRGVSGMSSGYFMELVSGFSPIYFSPSVLHFYSHGVGLGWPLAPSSGDGVAL